MIFLKVAFHFIPSKSKYVQILHVERTSKSISGGTRGGADFQRLEAEEVHILYILIKIIYTQDF